MFGYVAPHKCELKVCELTQYQAWYCGLCRTLRREYGQLPRLVLDYDCTFLALLLASVQGETAPVQQGRCGYKPFKGKVPMAQPCAALTYAADCNVLLYWFKLLDDWRDDRNFLSLFGCLLLRGAKKKAVRRQKAISADIEAGIQRLSALELSREQEIDKVSDAFADILRHIAASFEGLDGAEREILSWLGYHMGRWIYLMDAWEDREKDRKQGAYNPFLCADIEKERASFLLYASLSEMEKAYDLLTIRSNHGLLENIIFQGCRRKTRLLLEGTQV